MQAIFFARGPFASRLRESVAETNATKVKGWKSIDPPILERECAEALVTGFGSSLRPKSCLFTRQRRQGKAEFLDL